MPNRTVSKWFMVGATIGLVVGGLVVLLGYMVVIDQYDTKVLATPPWIEPQLCHVALIHKGDPGQECSIEGPDVVDESQSSGLNKDAIYTGSLTLAGVALFGGIFLVTPVITRSDSRSRRIAAVMVVMGPFALAGTHIWFATSMCCNDPDTWLQVVGVLTALFASLGVFGYVWLIIPHHLKTD